MKHIQLSLRSLKPCFAVLFCPDLRSYKPCFAVDRNPFAVNHIYIGIFLFVYSNNLAKTYVLVLLFWPTTNDNSTNNTPYETIVWPNDIKKRDEEEIQKSYDVFDHK